MIGRKWRRNALKRLKTGMRKFRSGRADKPGTRRFAQLVAQLHELLGEGDEQLKIDERLVPRGWIGAGRLPQLFPHNANERLCEIEVVIQFLGRRSWEKDREWV